MSTPLGLAIGNANEVQESIDVLAGGGPADVIELTLALAREMLAGVGMTDVDPADALTNGRAMDAWRRMITAQGGDPDTSLGVAEHSEEVRAESDGYITRLDALGLGIAAWRLGAGRERQGAPVQAGAGIMLHKQLGDPVRRGDLIMTLHTETPERMPRGISALAEACDGAGSIEIGAAPAPRKILLDSVGTRS